MSEKEKKSPSTPKKSKNAKNDATNKSGKFNTWVREMKSELAKVQWPSKKETTKHTVTVLCCVGLVGAFIWLYDFLAANVIEALISFT